MSRRYLLRAGSCLAAASALVLAPAVASAFQAQPHTDMTRDALRSEGFGDTALDVVLVTNWLNDYYEQRKSNALSGHGDGAIADLLERNGVAESWPISVVWAAENLHFDGSTRLVDTSSQEREWRRLVFATKRAVEQRTQARDALGVIAVMGMSLHAVQDFYAHSNWVEPKAKVFFEEANPYDSQGRHEHGASDGPGFPATGLYGSHPTWFDVPAADRSLQNIYSSSTTCGQRRSHGAWNADNNVGLTTSINKDWVGRPYFDDAYASAYLATRQWARAIRQWVNDPVVWGQVTGYAFRNGSDLDVDVRGMTDLSVYAGSWNGNGRAGSDNTTSSSTPKLIAAAVAYRNHGKTLFRRRWEELVVQVSSTRRPYDDDGAPKDTRCGADGRMLPLVPYAQDEDALLRETASQPLPAMPSVDDVRDSIDFLSVQIPRLRGVESSGLRPTRFMTASVDGLLERSGLIFEGGQYNEGPPYGPFTLMKAITRGDRNRKVPVITLDVLLRTGTRSGAGTDDEVFLAYKDGAAQLEVPYSDDFDDFENGRNDWYHFHPTSGMTLDDLDYLEVRKPSDGSDWLLEGITVRANGRTIYQNVNVDTWLNGATRKWRATNYQKPVDRTTREVPISLSAWSQNPLSTSTSAELLDINPLAGEKSPRFSFDYETGRYQGHASGYWSGTMTGAGDSARNEMTYKFRGFPVTAPMFRTASWLASPEVKLAGRPAVVQSAPGRLHFFVRGANNVLQHRMLENGAFLPWESLGGTLTSDPGATSLGQGRIRVTARGGDNEMYTRDFDPNMGWADWKHVTWTWDFYPTRDGAAQRKARKLDSYAPAPVAILGNAATVARADGMLWATYDERNWIDLGMPNIRLADSGPAAVSWGQHRIDVFVRGEDDAIWHTRVVPGSFTRLRGESWETNGAPWESIGGNVASAPSVASWSPGRFDVFARAQDGSLTRTSFVNGQWSGTWESAGGALAGDPSALAPETGKLQVFSRTPEGTLQQYIRLGERPFPFTAPIRERMPGMTMGR